MLHETGQRQVSGGSTGRRWRLAAFTLLSCLPANVVAQPVTQVAPPTREQVTHPIAPPRPPASQLEVEGGIERTPCALDGPEFQSIRFTVRGAEFEGLQGLTSADLAPSFAPFVGREVPISTVCEIRDRAAAILHDAGYIAAVQVPPQRIEGGVVRFQVLMAHLTQVRVRGEATGAEAVLAGYLGRLTRRPLFNRFEAERYLLLLQLSSPEIPAEADALFLGTAFFHVVEGGLGGSQRCLRRSKLGLCVGVIHFEEKIADLNFL